MSEIASKVQKIIVDKLGVDESEVTATASFTNDLGADSLDTVELIMEFEKEFGISIPDDQAEKIQTVGDAISSIHDTPFVGLLIHDNLYPTWYDRSTLLFCSFISFISFCI